MDVLSGLAVRTNYKDPRTLLRNPYGIVSRTLSFSALLTELVAQDLLQGRSWAEASRGTDVQLM